ncbi:hypothetical protein BC830DRAFT_1124700 [Chytriomyces sp. MP71]|nr:hypothetical protein BC830DRAFT_1136722 [Chytriomyces sp. MP71]KAI8614995.1 hypothetical protein BC830DRAFT_1124700 [Chytriomyces sp. MP71]
MAGLTSSCLILPLVSEACLETMLGIKDEKNDSVVREWQTALDFHGKGHLEVIPILVGSVDSKGAYNHFSGFGMAERLPEARILDSPTNATVKDTVKSLFSLQGVFLNPSDVSDKIGMIQARFSSQVWPAYRNKWVNQAELGPEPRYNCVQCLQDFAESENGEGSCRFHLYDGPEGARRGNIYSCCNVEDSALGCTRNHHRRKHHNDYQYGSFYGWRQNMMGYTHTSTAFAAVAANDFISDETINVSLGAVTKAFAPEANKLFVDAGISDMVWFSTFSRAEISSAHAGNPIFSIKNEQGEWAEATWIEGTEHQIVGVTIRCATKTSRNPSTATVMFSWPDANNEPVASAVEYARTAEFGEVPLLPDSGENPYKFPSAARYSGEKIVEVQVRDRDDSLPQYKSPNTKFRATFQAGYCRHEMKNRVDSFNVVMRVLNGDKDISSIANVRAFARLRVPEGELVALKVPDDGSNLVIASVWKKAPNVAVALSKDPYNQNILPKLVNGMESVELGVTVDLSAEKYCTDNAQGQRKLFSWIAYKAGYPIVLDIEFEDINGEVFGCLVEFPITSMRLTEPKQEAVYALACDDAISCDRSIIQYHSILESPNDAEEMDPTFVRNNSTRFCFSNTVGSFPSTQKVSISTFRRFVLAAEAEHAGSPDRLVTVDATEPIFNVRLPYNDNFDEIPFRAYAYAVIDLSRRSVVAIRFKTVSRTMMVIGYLPIPAYGDALDAEALGVSTVSVSATDTIQGWLEEERGMQDMSAGARAPVAQGMAPVSLRVKFESTRTNEGKESAGQVNVEALAAALTPLLTKQIEESVTASFQKTIDILLARIEELEVERKVQLTVSPASGPNVPHPSVASTSALSNDPVRVRRESSSVSFSDIFKGLRWGGPKK